jgi:2-phosphosulfolactate phosphatase
MTFDQAEFEVRCEWGEPGAQQLAPLSDVIVIVDVLSFSTCIDIANCRGAIVFPYRWKDASAQEFAASMDAELASERGRGRYSLSAASLMSLGRGTRLVLPSPHGSALSLMTGATPTLTGCLRNCRAVAAAAASYGRRIAVLPAGERWRDGSLRPAFEDLVGAGAIISHLPGTPSPEARAAAAVYAAAKSELNRLLKRCGSGKELIERGYAEDVETASAPDVSECVPTLVNGAYIDKSA